MKIVLFVEGHTEKKALPELFKRWLAQRVNRRAATRRAPSGAASRKLP